MNESTTTRMATSFQSLIADYSSINQPQRFYATAGRENGKLVDYSSITRRSSMPDRRISPIANYRGKTLSSCRSSKRARLHCDVTTADDSMERRSFTSHVDACLARLQIGQLPSTTWLYIYIYILAGILIEYSHPPGVSLTRNLSGGMNAAQPVGQVFRVFPSNRNMRIDFFLSCEYDWPLLCVNVRFAERTNNKAWNRG